MSVREKLFGLFRFDFCDFFLGLYGDLHMFYMVGIGEGGIEGVIWWYRRGCDDRSSTTSSVNGTGGASSVTLTTANLPAHNHTATDSGHTHANTLTDPGHVHNITVTYPGVGGSGNYIPYQAGSGGAGSLGTNSATTGITISNVSSTANISIGNTGSGTAFNILPTYTTVNYIIKY